MLPIEARLALDPLEPDLSLALSMALTSLRFRYESIGQMRNTQSSKARVSRPLVD